MATLSLQSISSPVHLDAPPCDCEDPDCSLCSDRAAASLWADIESRLFDDRPPPRLRRAKRLARQRRIREFVLQVKALACCALCGATEGLTFHHLIPETRRFRIAEAPRKTMTAVRREMRKCAILCRSCHDGVHDGSGLKPLGGGGVA